MVQLLGASLDWIIWPGLMGTGAQTYHLPPTSAARSVAATGSTAVASHASPSAWPNVAEKSAKTAFLNTASRRSAASIWAALPFITLRLRKVRTVGVISSTDLLAAHLHQMLHSEIQNRSCTGTSWYGSGHKKGQFVHALT